MRSFLLLAALVILSQTAPAQARNIVTIYDGKKVSDILAFIPASGCSIDNPWEDSISRGADRACVAGNLACNIHSVQYAADGSGQNSEWFHTGSCSFPVDPIDANVKVILEKAGINTAAYR